MNVRVNETRDSGNTQIKLTFNSTETMNMMITIFSFEVILFLVTEK